MKYKNICKFPIYIKCVGGHVQSKEVFEMELNDEIRKLLKENKIAVEELSTQETKKEAEVIESKPKSNKKKTSFDDDKEE